MRLAIRHLLITIFAGLLLLVGCSSTDSPATVPGTADTIARPDTEVFGAQIHLYEGSKLTTEVRADKIRRFDSIDSTAAYVVEVDILDTAGNVSSTVVGDSGVIRENTGFLQIFGHVVVNTKDKSVLETDYLTWNPDIDRIQTDAFVKITRRNDVITGWGMEADKDLNRIKILRQVSGTVRETER